jgi:phosphoglycerate dehydrogenase-like enzyme
MNRADLVLITHPDPEAVAREVEPEAGPAFRWCRLDDPGADGATVWFSAGVMPEVSLALPKLRWIHTGWAGVEGWFGRSEWRPGVILTRTVGDYPARLSQYVFGCLLARELDLPEAFHQMEARTWRRFVPGSLEGKRLLVVGMGAIGSEVARVGRALGMKVEGVRRTARAGDRTRGVRPVSDLPRLLAAADVVVNLLPHTGETESFWGEERFAALAEGAVFVNAGRGTSVDEEALLRGIHRGRPGSAILDVFREEPLPADHPLRREARVWITPHIAGAGTVPMMAAAFVTNWRRYRSGKPLHHRVDRRRGY